MMGQGERPDQLRYWLALTELPNLSRTAVDEERLARVLSAPSLPWRGHLEGLSSELVAEE